MRRFAFVILLALVGCKDPTSLTGVISLHIDRATDELVISTGSSDPYYYFAVDRGRAPGINWAPCTDPATCPSVRRGAPARLPLSQILVLTNDAIVYHWHLVQTSSGYAPDVIRTTTISR